MGNCFGSGKADKKCHQKTRAFSYSKKSYIINLNTCLIFSICLRQASSGTTPPYLLCISCCEAIIFDLIFITAPLSPPSEGGDEGEVLHISTTAAAVSSHEVSIPRINIINTVFSLLFFIIHNQLYSLVNY